MRIREVILDWFMTTRLYEMSAHRDRAKREISSGNYELAKHLIKLIIYGKVRDYNHWCNEVNGWLRPINILRVKPNHKRLSYETLRYLLWEERLETIQEVQDYMELVEAEYRKSYRMIEVDPQQVHKIIMSAMSDVCRDLSLGKFTDIRNYIK